MGEQPVFYVVGPKGFLEIEGGMTVDPMRVGPLVQATPLVLAAPALLEALRELVSHSSWPGGDPFYYQVRAPDLGRAEAAIAKAEGN